MENIFLQTIRKDRDAPYVNRGFYFQYLTVLKKWIEIFINGVDTIVYTEVDNDIKEVGEKIIYTQVKSYVSSFSLNSKAVKKELIGFFTQYLEQADVNPELEFHFYTNTSVKENDTLLSAWMENQPLKEGELQLKCAEKLRQILLVQFEEDFESNTGKNITEFQKNAIQAGFDEIKSIINSEKILIFLSTIHWHFGNETPEESVISLHASVLEDLKNEKFEGKPAPMLMEALLSEIYRCSQLKSPEDRKVDIKRLLAILESKDAELETFVNKELVSLLEVRLYSVHQRMTELENLQKENEERIHSAAVRIDEILSKNGQGGIAHIPKNLSFIPFINPIDIFGRETDLVKIGQIIRDNKCVLINAGGGMGKSTLAKLYIHSCKDKYDHFLWINCENGLSDSLTTNETLSERINLDGSIPLDKRFSALIDKLESIKGSGLIVLDNLDADFNDLDAFRNLGRWNVLVTSRLRLKEWVTYELDFLSFAAAKALYKKFEPSRPTDDMQLQDLFEFVEYNILTIELIAKTIHLSFDLTLDDFLEYLQGQRLDDNELDVDLDDNILNTRLLILLNKTFDIGRLNKQEYFYMEFFALLPSEGITLTDLVKWYGKEAEKSNKIEFARAINSLHNKGLIRRSENEIKMDRMFQESVIYQSRKVLNPFIGQILHISFLAARLQEGIKADATQAIHFIRYSQAILKNIKEPFRRSLYQPLLLLENETLYIRNWLEKPDQLLPLWENLLQRARVYLGEANPMVVTILNNYALALLSQERTDDASLYFDTAIEAAKATNIDIASLLNMLSNRANIFIMQGDIKGFERIFTEIMEIREKNNLGIDASFALQCHTVGKANLSVHNYSGAKRMLALAIMSHKQLPEDERNDINLIIFLCDMAACCLALKMPETAEKAAVQATSYLKKLKIIEGFAMIKVLHTLIALSHYKGDHASEKELREILLKQI